MTWLPHIDLEEALIFSLAGVILAGVAALLIGIGWATRRRAQASLAWPAAPGRVLSAAVEQSTSSNTGTTYSAVVRYVYEIGGRQYQNNRRAFGGSMSSGNRGEAERDAAHYPAGSSLPVYYNPADPQDAVLERRAATAGLLFGLGALFVVLGCGGSGCLWVLFIAQAVLPAGQ